MQLGAAHTARVLDILLAKVFGLGVVQVLIGLEKPRALQLHTAVDALPKQLLA